jgi:hypothetical protein
MSREALKLALEALEHGAAYLHHELRYEEAITAIKEALAQPEQEPVGLLSDEVVENAGREWWAQTRHTNGPRILAVYASQSIMDEVHSTARIIMQAALNQITSPPQRQPLTDDD